MHKKFLRTLLFIVGMTLTLGAPPTIAMDDEETPLTNHSTSARPASLLLPDANDVRRSSGGLASTEDEEKLSDMVRELAAGYRSYASGAKSGVIEDMVLLGRCYENGAGVTPSDEKSSCGGA